MQVKRKIFPLSEKFARKFRFCKKHLEARCPLPYFYVRIGKQMALPIVPPVMYLVRRT